jgi:hypothetical protein
MWIDEVRRCKPLFSDWRLGAMQRFRERRHLERFVLMGTSPE